MKRGQIKERVRSGLQVVLGQRRTDTLLLKRNMRRYKATGIIFIHIPKCAGTSVSRALYGGSLGHRTAQELRGFDPNTFDRLPKFSVLRDPIARAYSAWRYCSNGGAQEGWAQPHPDYGLEEFQSFERFACEWLPNRDIEKLDFVFRSQAGFVEAPDGTPLVQDLLILPNLQSSWPRISALASTPISDLPILNSNGGETGQSPDFSPQTLASLRTIYSRDVYLYESVL